MLNDYIWYLKGGKMAKKKAKNMQKGKKPVKRAKKPVAKKVIQKKPASRKLPQAVVVKKSGDMLLAVIALILNLIIPGIGSLVGGKVRAGVWQLVITILAAFVMVALFKVGLFIAFLAWVWALVTGIQLIIESQ